MEHVYQLAPVSPVLSPECYDAAPVQTFHAEVGGIPRTWHIFFPSAYDGSTPLPLLVTLHGNGGYRPERNPWHYTAQRAGFIVLYPEAVSPFQWNIWGIKTDQGAPDDVAYLDYLLDEMLESYAVDRTRIYMHGQSMGDNMATYYAYKRGERLAALAVTSGPTLPSVAYHTDGTHRFVPETPIPVARVHGELDNMCGLPSTYGIPKREIEAALSDEEQIWLRAIMEQMQLSLWQEINGTLTEPQLHFDEKRNIEWYPGHCGRLVYYSMAGGLHHPNPDVYDMLWEEALDGYQRIGDTILDNAPEKHFPADSRMVAAADGCDCIYQELHIRRVSGLNLEIRESVLYGSLDFIRQTFPDIHILQEKEAMSATLHYDGNTMQLAAGHNLVLVSGYVKPVSPVLVHNGKLHLPLSQILPILVSCRVQILNGIACFTDHPFVITQDGARKLRQMLLQEQLPEGTKALEFEAAIKDKIEAHMRKMEM